MTRTRIQFALLVLGLGVAAPVKAQLPSASTAALGMGENFTAAGRGYQAIAWNAALLGLPGNPASSLALAPVRIVTGLDPVTMGDIAEFSGRVVSNEAKMNWLTRVQSEGSEQGAAAGDITYLAAQIGRIGAQVSSRVHTIADLTPGAVQLLLFGNAGRTGQPEAIVLDGSAFDAIGTSTLAASYAHPFTTASGSVAVGVTVKYTIGHFLASGRDNGSTLTADPRIDIEFPMVGTVDTTFKFNNGSGIGLDVGFAMQRQHMTLSAVVRNIFNSFEWDVDNLVFRPGEALFEGGNSTGTTDFEPQPYENAPQQLRDLVDDLRYKPTVAAGLALTPTEKVTVTADVRSRLGEGGINEDPKFHAGAGVEYKVRPYLPLRAGAALITDGFQFGAGVGVDLGPFTVSASALRRTGDLGQDNVFMLTLLSTGR